MHATHRLPGLVLVDHWFGVPLDHAEPSGPKIQVFAREAVRPGSENLPWLVFFQGGPGFEAPRPLDLSGWIKRATRDYRVLLLDQRGTGRSAPVTFETLTHMTGRQQADYLRHFRSDAIVQDAELIRRELLGTDGKWSVLGQSYGGFCTTRYLSVAPESLREAFITGGLPRLVGHADDVYRQTYPTARRKNELFYERYPDDVAKAREIADYLADNHVELPCGDRLTVRKFQQLGMHFGMSDGFEKVHYLLETALPGHPGYTFLRGFETALEFDTHPIFAILHEMCYTQAEASNWSAHRVRDEFPDFDATSGGPLLFTGEMIYPWMFEEYRTLRPLQEPAEILATTSDWPVLYDPEALRNNTVPCAAAVYTNDMYVPRAFSMETAETIAGIRVWETDEYEHNGLRADGERVLGKLIDLLRS